MRGRSHRADVYGRAKRSTNRLDSKDGKSNPEVSGHCLHLLASPKANGDTGTVLGGGGENKAQLRMRQRVVGSEEEAVVESAVFRTFIAPGWVLFVFALLRL